MKANLAVSILAYNRVDKLTALFESLVDQDEFESLDVYLYIDGPRKGDENSNKKCKEYGLDLARSYRNIHYYPYEKNAQSLLIKKSVDFPLQYHPSVVRLPDDVLLKPGAIARVIDLLQQYEKDPEVCAISLYGFDIEVFDDERNGIVQYKSNIFTGSGWATWRHKRPPHFLPMQFSIGRRVQLLWGNSPHLLFYFLIYRQGKTLAGDMFNNAVFQTSELCVVRPTASCVVMRGEDGSGYGRVNKHKSLAELSRVVVNEQFQERIFDWNVNQLEDAILEYAIRREMCHNIVVLFLKCIAPHRLTKMIVKLKRFWSPSASGW